MIRFVLKMAFKMRIPGVGHFARLLYRQKKTPYLRTRLNKKWGGAAFNADFRHHTDQIILRTGEYEVEVSAALRASLGPSEVFWDIGANTGYHSILMRSLIPSTQVVSFEPNPEIQFRLIDNLRINGFDCLSLPIGLGAEMGVQTLHVVVEGNSGLTTLRPNSFVDYDSKLGVIILTGDFVVENSLAPSPNTIKIDVEGSELDVLKGMPGILQSSSLRTIIFEALDAQSLREIGRYLEHFQFTAPERLDDTNNFISKSKRVK
jgi:FkbM family methyltransferase